MRIKFIRNSKGMTSRIGVSLAGYTNTAKDEASQILLQPVFSVETAQNDDFPVLWILVLKGRISKEGSAVRPECYTVSSHNYSWRGLHIKKF